MTNKKLGNDFESKFCELLFQNGFWAHNMAQNHDGQPADVIAVRNKKAYLIDCKVCSRGRFALSRIEDNQHTAMETWKQSGNGVGWFALLCADKTFMVEYDTLKGLSVSKSSIGYAEICFYGIPIEEWVVWA